MAAELLPPDGPITAAAAATTTTTTSSAATDPTTTATTTALALAESENQGPPPPIPKRQRRPSVRLGEIGDHHHQTAHDTHVRRSTKQLQLQLQQHHPWRIPKDSSKSVKARSLTHLVNGNNNEIEELEVHNNNQNGELNLVEFGHRRKAKRGATKRVRSNWISSNSRIDEEDTNLEISNGEEGFVREFDLDSDSPLKDQSPVHSVENIALDFWQGNRRTGTGSGRFRVTESRENEGIEMENDDNSERKWEGVRTWLIELGLSRYAPVFEIHEVDDQVLPLLTLEDLKDMGINAVGSRRKLYSAIQKLRKGFHCVFDLPFWSSVTKALVLFLALEWHAKDSKVPACYMWIVGSADRLLFINDEGGNR